MHFMNPQRGAHLGLTQAPAPAAGPGANMDGAPDDTAGIGSAQSGYAGPENGPFECQNCIHFDGKGACNNPQVQSDPEVNGQVEAEGCCNLFNPGEENEGEEEQGEAEEGAIPGAGEQV